MVLRLKTKIGDLLKEYPFLLDYLAGLSPQFARLKNPVMRRTIGRVASLQQAAGFGGMAPDELLEKIRLEIERQTGRPVEIERDADYLKKEAQEREARLETLKDIIRVLHRGGELDVQKRRFRELIKDVSPAEIAAMEQALIREGMPEEEVKRLCDVHVEVFKESLGEQPLPSAIPGHPLHTLMEENRALEKHLEGWNTLLERLKADRSAWQRLKREAAEALAVLFQVDKHYLRKENQLFPLLEAKGISVPSKVMWAVHDDIRTMMRDLKQNLDSEDPDRVVVKGKALGETLADMIYKEEKILLPMALETLDEADWARVKKGEAEIGFAWVEPGTGWQPSVSPDVLTPIPSYRRPGADVELTTGSLSPGQVDLLLTHLPLDVTFVDETDTVRYYSGSPERIFPRSPAIIGRKVQNCHPPASVHVVNRILSAFRDGSRSAAGFWIRKNNRLIHIRYFAVRDGDGTYRGCLEVSQDVTEIQDLAGEKRLLDWD